MARSWRGEMAKWNEMDKGAHNGYQYYYFFSTSPTFVLCSILTSVHLKISDTSLSGHVVPSLWLSGVLSSEVDSLRPLPGLRQDHEDSNIDKHNRPFPSDTIVQEHLVVDHRNVQRGEHDKEHTRHREEQELVAPEVHRPRLQSLGHVEERPARVNQLPGEEEEDPRHGGVAGRAGAEDGVAGGRVGDVAVETQVSGLEAKDDESEGSEDAAGHDCPVDDHVDHEFGREDAILEL